MAVPFAREVRERRTKLGLSQAALAERATWAGAPMIHSTVAKIEAGARGVTVAEAVVLAEVLDADLDRMSAPQFTATITPQSPEGRQEVVAALSRRARDARADLQRAEIEEVEAREALRQAVERTAAAVEAYTVAEHAFRDLAAGGS